jgi:DNA-binding CsgD family transcriptional regulator
VSTGPLNSGVGRQLINNLKRKILMAQRNHLSNREEEVVKLLLQGKSNKLIASALGISGSTVEFHLKNIYAKYQVSSRVELILKLGNPPERVDPEKLGPSVVDENRENTETLGLSVVDGKGENAVNRDRLNLWNWATSLREAVSIIGKELKMKNVLNSEVPSGVNPITFFESIRVCLIKYADFTGRASRPEFWWFTLFVILAAGALTYLSEMLGGVFLIATLLPLLAAGTRRLHDIGRSGVWQLFLLVPVAGVVLVGILWALPPANPRPDDTLQA